jgi:hypothetical protein
MHRAAMLCVAAIVVGCGGASDALHVSFDDVDPSGGFWTIRATCTGGHLQVEFRPGEQLSVRDLGHASSEGDRRRMREARARRSLRRGASPSHGHAKRRGPGRAGPRADATLLRRRRLSRGRGPPGLDHAKRHRRWRLPRPARRPHGRDGGDREGGVRVSGRAAAVVASALQPGVATLISSPTRAQLARSTCASPVPAPPPASSP